MDASTASSNKMNAKLPNAEILSHDKQLCQLIGYIYGNLATTRDENMDILLKGIIREVSRYSKVDRCGVFLFSHNGEFIQYAYEWRTKGVTKRLGQVKELRTNELPWLMSQLARLEPLHVLDIDMLPPEAHLEQIRLKLRGTRSLLMIPIEGHDHLVGFISFETVNGLHNWNLTTIERLRLVTQAIGTALRCAKLSKKQKRIEELYRTVFENSGIAMAILDKNMKVLDINNRVEQLSGYTREEILSGKVQWYDFIVKKDHKRIRNYHKARLQGEKNAPASYETEFVGKNGTRGAAIVTASVIPKTDRTIVSIADFTRLKTVEDDLRKSQEDYRLLVENQTELIIKVNPHGQFTYVSPSYCAMFGKTEAELLERNYLTLVHRDDQDKVAQAVGTLFHPPYTCYVEMRALTAQGWRWIAWSDKGITNEEGNVAFIIGVGRDITKRKEKELELEKTLARVRTILGGVINVVMVAVEKRDPYTAGHMRRVANLARAIASALELETNIVEGIRVAATVHDVGKIQIPAEILSKPGTFTMPESILMQTHSLAGYEILRNIDFPWPIAEIVYQHHERLDGSGYPRGLKRGEILLEARIIGVADVVEAMSSHRPYRAALGIEAALEEIGKGKGTLYDEAVVDACVKLFREEGFEFDQLQL